MWRYEEVRNNMSFGNSDRQLSEISLKLDTVIRLAALSLIRDVKVAKEKMKVLSYAGFKHDQIAEMLQTTSHTVRQRLYESRKKRQ